MSLEAFVTTFPSKEYHAKHFNDTINRFAKENTFLTRDGFSTEAAFFESGRNSSTIFESSLPRCSSNTISANRSCLRFSD